MSSVSATEIRSIVEAVLAELSRNPDGGSARTSTPNGQGRAAPPAAAAPPPVEQARPTASAAPQSPSRAGGTSDGGDIDVPDPDAPEERRRIGVEHPANASGLANLAGSTGARLAVGRAGPRRGPARCCCSAPTTR